MRVDKNSEHLTLTCMYENVLLCVSIDTIVYIVRMFIYIVQECMSDHRILCVRHPAGLHEASLMRVYETIMSYSRVFTFRHIFMIVLMFCDMVSGSCVSMVYVNSVVTGCRHGTIATGMVIVHGFVYIMVLKGSELCVRSTSHCFLVNPP